MCGIAGLFLRDETSDDAVVARMRDAVTHRGPDDCGNFLSAGLGLGHRRLSIIDLGGGHQPMTTEDGRFVIVFNGEIYNYLALRQELEAAGARFRTHSDTEVILQLHARHGDAAVERLNGIFAYAIWDVTTRRLLLARDRAGIKPLYLASSNRGVAFASEIKSLFASGLVAAQLDHRRVGEYLLFRQVAGPQHLFAGVESLPPGHMVEVVEGRAGTPRAFWDPMRMPAPFAGTFDEATDAPDTLLNACVSRQMIADVPLGTFCSGGIDSSLVTAVAAQHAGRPINTFSVGFDEADYDESHYARLAAQVCKTTHHELRLSEARFAELLPRLIWHHDLPLNFANSVHIFAVSELARQHVTVVLTGEGADELFGGYPRYYIPRIVERIEQLPGAVRWAATALLDTQKDDRFKKLARFARRSMDEGLLLNTTGVDPTQVRALLRPTADLDLTWREALVRAVRGSAVDNVSGMAQIDFVTYLVSILNRQDKMSMATSLEARVPFLDNEMIDFARSLPLQYKQTFRRRKRVLMDVAARYLPAEIIHRRKSGFGVPLRPWFAADGPVGRLLTDVAEGPEVGELLDRDVLRSLVDAHRRMAADHSELLWGIVNLGLWRRAFHV
jgi:asparagine synthase (glutamine-hydrolysing)